MKEPTGSNCHFNALHNGHKRDLGVKYFFVNKPVHRMPTELFTKLFLGGALVTLKVRECGFRGKKMQEK